MADIADIGFRADTSDLSDAKLKLEALVPAAAKAEKASKTLALAKVKEAAAAKASTAAVLAAAKASGTASVEDIAAARSADRKAAAVLAAAKANYAAASASQAAAAASRQQGSAAVDAANKTKMLAAAANDAGLKMGAARANVGNLAAQFQDIGVTAAMGMSPMMIALQQGTQISAVLGPMGLGASLKFLASAFLSIISPMSLLTLGLVGLAAAGFQMIDWAGLASDALNFTADALETVAVYAAGAAAALTLLYVPAIIGGIGALYTAFGGLYGILGRATVAIYLFAAGLYATVGLPVLIVAGLLAIVVAANVFSDELTQILGFDIVKAAKSGINFIIGGFVGGYKAIKKTWSMLPAAIGDAAISAANRAISAIAKMVNKAIEGINGLIAMLPDWLGGSSGGITFRMSEGATFSNPYAGAAEKVNGIAAGEIRSAQETDYVGAVTGYVGDLASSAADYLRGLASDLQKGDPAKGEKGGGSTGRVAKGEKTDAEKFAEIEKDAQARIRTMQAEQQQIGMTADAAARLKYETELLNQASQKNITLTDAQKVTIGQLAQNMADLEIETNRMKGFKEITEGIDESKRALEQERAEIFMTKEQIVAYRIEQNLLNEARQKGIEDGDIRIKQLKEEAARLAATTIEIDRMRKNLDEARGATRSFLGDLKNSLIQSKSLFASFGDAVLNILNKVLDKMLDIAAQNIVGDGKSGGGGIISSLFSLFTTIGGAKSGVPAAGNPNLQVGNRPIAPFAKGGAFTNGIFNQPTLFKFAKGGAMGVMGEAGPEAVMPLQRGPDGSLGVQMYGGRGSNDNGQVVKVIVEANDYFDARVDQRASNVAAPMAIRAGLSGADLAEQRIGRKRRNAIP